MSGDDEHEVLVYASKGAGVRRAIGAPEFTIVKCPECGPEYTLNDNVDKWSRNYPTLREAKARANAICAVTSAPGRPAFKLKPGDQPIFENFKGGVVDLGEAGELIF